MAPIRSAPAGPAPASEAKAVYGRLVRRRLLMMASMALATCLVFVLDVSTGPAMLAPAEVARALAGASADPMISAIVWSIRLPVALMALCVGAALGLSGAIMQTILNNPLASSYTLGISAGAGFGAGLVIVLGFGAFLPDAWTVPIAAFLFAGIACAAVWGIGAMRGASAEMLVLAGIALMFLFQALLSMLQFVASQEALQQIVFWLFGSLQKATWSNIPIVAAVLGLTIPLLMADAWRLTAMKLGDERTRGLGVDVTWLRLRSFALISALTGIAVAFVGTIGFVGLVAPHIARIMVGEDQRAFLPAAALAGALLLGAASVASKVVVPGVIVPIGIVTALIGVPFFVWLVIGNRRRYW